MTDPYVEHRHLGLAWRWASLVSGLVGIVSLLSVGVTLARNIPSKEDVAVIAQKLDVAQGNQEQMLIHLAAIAESTRHDHEQLVELSDQVGELRRAYLTLNRLRPEPNPPMDRTAGDNGIFSQHGKH